MRDAHCEGVVEVGTRSVVAIGPTRPPHPRTYARWNGRKKTEFRSASTGRCDLRTLIERWHGAHGKRINIALLTPTLRDEHVEN
jgi:hypothetical protein